MKTIKDYCLNNIDKLTDYNQNGFEWKSTYDMLKLQKNKLFNTIYNEIPDLIDRIIIIKHIQEKKYFLAFIEIMLWGQIGARPGSNKSKKTEILEKVINYNQKNINIIFELSVSDNIKDIENLYSKLENNGDLKIPEVDVSYFTKILSFASESSKNEFKLLIFDKWTKLVHVHLCSDLNDNTIEEFYTINTISKLYYKSEKENIPTTKLIYPKKGKSFKTYIDYCKKMDFLAKTLSKESGREITAFKLEAFLFGTDLKGKNNKTDNNPRYWIQQNFAKSYL